MLLCASFILPTSVDFANAEDTSNNNFRICQKVEGSYVDYEGTVLDYKPTLYFLIALPQAVDAHYYYYESEYAIENINNVTNWSTDFSSSDTINDNGIDYKELSFTPLGDTGYKYYKYIYFKRSYSDTDEYSRSFPVQINLSVSGEENLGFPDNSIKATYLSSSGNILDYKGSWINTKLTLKITTKWMQNNGILFDSTSERLFYSIDENADYSAKDWIPLSANVLELQQSLSCSLYFKLTNASQTEQAYTVFSYPVNIDMAKPEFDLTIGTKDAENTETEYFSGNWTSHDVVFVISAKNNCLSGISYYVKTSSDGEYTSLGSTQYIQSSSIAYIRFMARNEAGGEAYSIDGFSVNIDKISPIVNLNVLTDNPDVANVEMVIEKTEIARNGDTIEYGYVANKTIYLNISNNAVYGGLSKDRSPLNYYYQVKQDGADEFSDPKKITAQIKVGEDFYYRFTDVFTGSGISTKKTYRIYIESDTGLKSQALDSIAILVNDNFDISVEEITYSANVNGWANAPIPVYVKVFTDTKLVDNLYTIPTTKYTFHYSATDVANMNYSAIGEYDDVKSTLEGKEEGRSWYKFMLDASADSKFNIYAVNMAGKKSSNTFTSENKIRIDTTLPEENIEFNATVISENSAISNSENVESGQWVCGNISLRLRVKIGISNIFVYELHYIKDENGNPQRDSEGKIVWLSNTSALKQSSVEDNIAIYAPERGDICETDYLGFRVYTGSGIYRDVEFLANIDKSEIILSKISLGQNQYGEDIWEDVVSSTMTLETISEDFNIKLMANDEQADHFNYYLYYLRDGVEGFDEINDINHYLQVLIKENKKDTIVLKFYLQSKAYNYDVDNQKVYKKSYDSNPAMNKPLYIIEIPYNTKNITINYSIEINGETAGSWNRGELNASIGLKRSDDGDNLIELSYTDIVEDNYKYYYMLIKQKDYINENTSLNNGTWILVNSADGTYDASSHFNFKIEEFNESSFYGYIAFSVCSEGGYRSSSSGFVENVIRIDNTIPDLADAIILSDDGLSQNNNYYTNTTLQLIAKNYDDRAPISYYYFIVEGDGTDLPDRDNAPSGSDLGKWKLLVDPINFNANNNAYTPYKVLLYAVNTLAISNDAADYYYLEFNFYIDPCALSGRLSYSPYDGGYLNAAIGLWAYSWLERAKFTLSLEEKDSAGNEVVTKAKLYYSVNDGEWSLLKDLVDANSANEIIIDKNTFENTIYTLGVMGTFTFKAVNLAGTEYIYPEKIYIAMDNEAPEFEVNLTINGSHYDGGSVDFNDTTGIWSSTDIMININLIKANVSGTDYRYFLKYYEDSSEKTTEGKSVPNSKSFSSYGILFDNILFPNRSGDVVLIIKAINIKNVSYYSEQQVRMRIDKTMPTFTLRGDASSTGEASVGVEIGTGDWTNHSQVVVSKTSPAKNTSKVSYKVIYEDETSTNKEQFNWTQGNSLPAYDHSCTLTVIATSEAGLSVTNVFQVNIDTIAPRIMFMGGINVVEGANHYIDLKVVVYEENIHVCEYITKKGDSAGFPLTPAGYIISTSSVDNSTSYDQNAPEGQQEYRGYVKIHVEDYAGNSKEIEFYMLPFGLTVNTITLSDTDAHTLEEYEKNLDMARVYMESSRIVYFENLIERLKDRISTLEQEISDFRAYLETLAQRISYELKSDYDQMYNYLETYKNYEAYGKGWMQKAIIGDASSKYSAYYKNLNSVFAILQAEMKEVRNDIEGEEDGVEEKTKKLPAKNVVVADDYNDVLSVFDSYNNLTTEQKACFDTDLYNKLLTIKKKCETLLLIDSDTGISIDGNLAPGARIKVVEYEKSSEYFMNAQSSILGAIPNTEARAIISINQITIDGAASQTTTGNIKVVLPIPTEWQEYITFNVYKYSTDGTITKIENNITEGDGKSVWFFNNGLATFVLCAKANIDITDSDDGSFGTLLGLKLDVTMVKNLSIIGGVLFGVMILIIIIAGIRRKRFLNTYNRAYRASRYRKGIQEIPKKNTMPRTNPLKEEERVKTPTHPY